MPDDRFFSVYSTVGGRETENICDVLALPMPGLGNIEFFLKDCLPFVKDSVMAFFSEPLSQVKLLDWGHWSKEKRAEYAKAAITHAIDFKIDLYPGQW